MTDVKALKKLYVAQGGSAEDVASLNTIAEVISAMADVTGVKNVSAVPCPQSNTYWGTDVSDMQGTDIVVGDGIISGTLKYVASGTLVTDWKSHHFIALKFIDPNGADEVKVGIKGSVALDPDMEAVIAVEDLSAPLKVVITKNGITKTQEFNLGGLTLADA
ncbi:MAG: hypothetical protein K6F88_00320 [Ruminococcus sp.]|nr:hypothetical protein [Ruminococcus sp.]